MNLQPFASQLALRIALFLLALLLSGAVLVMGVSYLAQALYQTLLPSTNAAVASAATAVLCLAPAFGLILLLARRSHGDNSDNKPSDGIRELVRENPWEALGAVFILGVSQSSRSALDPETLRQMVALLQKERDEPGTKR